MADEAFALSPISARAALPGEEDYAAISEAFMETSRGRWFLTEYAKRNRNADTRMVLDAVARIEQSLVTQKEETQAAQREALAAQQQAVAAEAATLAAANLAAATAAAEAANTKLTEALAAIRDAVETAQASATEAFDGLALEQRQAAVRKGARVLREIAWRLREIGNDSRICDLIDSQVAVIEQAAEQIAADEARAALGAAFAVLDGRLAEFSDDRAPAPTAEAATAAPAPAAPEMPPAAMAETSEAAPPQDAPEASAISFSEPPDLELQEAELQEVEPAEAALAEAETALADAEALELAEVTHTEVLDTEVSDETADAHDEAILDMIAMEMGAPDPIDDDEIAAAVTEHAHFAEPVPVEQDIVAEAPEPVAASLAMPPQPVAEAVAAPAMEVSLGSSIIASGMLSKPAKAANDPLAPIRRMSQVEKIAFFS
jgi:hypothetical protein